MGLVLAFDLGGTRLKAGLVDPATSRVAARDVASVEGLGVDDALAVVADVGRRLTAGAADDLVGIGLSVPGIVDNGRVTVLPGKFAGVEGVDLAGWLRTTFAVDDVVVQNDAIAYGLGVVAGLADPSGRIVVLTIGTGVGCTVIEDGRPALVGPFGGGLLGGHLPISDPTGPLDTAGNAGTFEARCRAERILGEALEAGSDAADVPGVLMAAANGDPAAIRGISAYRGWLLRGLVAVTHAYTPRLIVVGGGPVSTAGSASVLLDDLATSLAGKVWRGTAPAVVAAQAGDHAALQGLASQLES